MGTVDPNNDTHLILLFFFLEKEAKHASSASRPRGFGGNELGLYRSSLPTQRVWRQLIELTPVFGRKEAKPSPTRTRNPAKPARGVVGLPPRRIDLVMPFVSKDIIRKEVKPGPTRTRNPAKSARGIGGLGACPQEELVFNNVFRNEKQY